MIPKNFKYFSGFLNWQEKHIGQQRIIYILSFIIGIISGFAAVFLKNVVHYTQHFLTHNLAENEISILYLLYPLIGITLTVVFIKVFVNDNIGHGVSRILYAISKKNGRLKSHNNYSSIIASTLTIGFGGSVGLEAPIVLTGSSIGSSFGRLFKMNYKSTIILIGCGAAGAIAGIFKAPIAAVIFGLEVLMLDLTMWSLIPLLISAVTGATVSYFFLGEAKIFSFQLIEEFTLHNIPYYIMLGIFTGLISLYFTKGTYWIEKLFGKINHFFVKIIIGGISLGLLILLIPPLYGEGYNILNILLDGNVYDLADGSIFYGFKDKFWIFTFFIILIILLKVFATTITNESGGVGGVFAPSLFLGGISGFLLSRILNKFDFIYVPEKNFVLVGMAGIMAGVMHAPLTAIFLIAEITGGYGLFIPLIITATISYITIFYFEPHSIYTHRLAKRGELLTHHKDQAILTLIDMKKIIETDFIKFDPNQKLADIVKGISKSKRNIFPVVNDRDTLIGMVLLDDIRHIIFNTDMYKSIYVRDLMTLPPAYVSPNEPMESVMKKFEKTGSWNLPVIDKGKYIGFLSKSKMFSVYRKWLLDISED